MWRNDPPPNPLPNWEGGFGIFKLKNVGSSSWASNNLQTCITGSPPFLGEGLGEGFLL